MSKENYKRLGDYIQPVNIRNKDLQVTKLLGVSIKKELMLSKANTIGTNMMTYKVVKRDEFVYGPVTSRNGDKIAIALLQDNDEAIVSQAYIVFKVNDENELNPEYLMMWFRRPEFDRYARFKSHGSARETFDWEEMCEVELPIPSIEKQNEIVAEYNTIVNRIKLNEQLNQKLEETAQSIYKHWFVDFEFPNEQGKPYKSSGGKMLYNEVLEKEIPEGWEDITLNQVMNIKHGFAFKGEYITTTESDNILLTPGNFNIGGGFKGKSFKYYVGNIPQDYIFKTGDIMVTMTDLSKATDTLGYPALIPLLKDKALLHNQRLGKIELFEGYNYKYFFYWLMRETKYRNNVVGSSTGTTVKHTSPTKILDFEFAFPNDISLLDKFQYYIENINQNIEQQNIENQTLLELMSISLSKMSKL